MTTEAAVLMAKKKAAKDKGKRSVISIRGSDAWYAWYTELAEFARMPGTVLIDNALAEFAERRGFKKPPPR
jgi:hypothetical protein